MDISSLRITSRVFGGYLRVLCLVYLLFVVGEAQSVSSTNKSTSHSTSSNTRTTTQWYAPAAESPDVVPNPNLQDTSTTLSPIIHVKVAALLPRDDRYLFSIARVAPAITLALEEVKNTSIIDPRVHFSVEYRDSSCDVAIAINEAFNFYMDHNVDVYFGPFCDYAAAPVSRQIRFWDLPMVTAGAMAADFASAAHFPMLTRVGYNFNSLAGFLHHAFSHYNWGKMKLVFDDVAGAHIVEKFCRFAADSIHLHFLRNNIGIDYFKITNNPDKFEERLEQELGDEYASELFFVMS